MFVKFRHLLLTELRRPFVQSSLQLALLGLIVYYLSMIIGADYACYSTGLGDARTALSCQFGEMSALAKLMILSGITAASIICGRAASLVERSLIKQDKRRGT